jgi:hypothetical protein
VRGEKRGRGGGSRGKNKMGRVRNSKYYGNAWVEKLSGVNRLPLNFHSSLIPFLLFLSSKIQ